MKQLILFLFYVIFLFTACSVKKDKDILRGMPSSMSHLYYVSDSIAELSLKLDSDLNDFRKVHPALFEMNNTLLGRNERSEQLLIQECKETIFNEWVKDKAQNVLKFQNWAIYELNLGGHKKLNPLYVSFNNGFMIVSHEGYLVEEALLAMEGDIRNLEDVSPEINTIEKGEFYQNLRDLPVVQRMGNITELNSLLEQKIIGKIKTDDALYFEGEILDLDAPDKIIDSTSAEILSFIPKDVSHMGVYNQRETNALFFNELSIKSPINYATFYLSNGLEEDSPFLMVDLKNEHSGLLEIIGNKYGVLEEIDDYFLPIIRVSMDEICNEIKELPYTPCISNPYVFLMDKYLIFAKSLNSLDMYMEGFLMNQSFLNKDFLNTIPLMTKKGKINNDFHYFKQREWGKGAILILKKNNDISFYLTEEKNIDKEPIKKISTYFNKEKIKLNIFALPHKKKGGCIIFQDESNDIFFMDKNNKLMHSITIDEEIQSRIHHFKDYETDDDRYIFNTKNKIYILDSNAENLHNSPMELSSLASNGIGLMDIENTRSTYAFLACENGNFYGYDLTKGLKPMPSWNPLINTGAIQDEMIFLEGQDEMHFAYVNKNNELISLNREAESRFKPVMIEEEFGNKIQVDYSTKGKERFVLHNGKGKLKIINTKGQFFFLILNNGKEKGDFLLMDIQGTEEKEYIFLSKDSIAVHAYNDGGFNQILALDNIYGINEIFEIKISTNRSLLGGLNQSKNRIYLLNNNGELVKGFPLEGDRAFAMFPVKNNQYLIVTIVEDKIITYLLSDSAFNSSTKMPHSEY